MPYWSVRVRRSTLSHDRYFGNLHQEFCGMPRPVCRVSAMDGHPPMLEINDHGRLVSTSPLSLGCIGWIISVVSNSLYGIIALYDMG